MTMPDKRAKKVVVTGLGVTSALGNDVHSFWENLCAGNIGYAHLSLLEEKETPFRVGGYLGGLSSLDLCCDEELSAFDRSTQLALIAASQAVRQADLPHPDGQTVGVVMGTTCGANDVVEIPGFEENWFSDRQDQCPEASFAKYDHCSIANAVSRRYGFDGPSYVVGTACSSGNHAIGEALNMIREGEAEIVLCGGADAFTLLPAFGFYSMKSLADEKCTPFERDREGMVLGEGAAVLVLEELESARARGVTLLAEVSSWFLNCDARNFAAPLESGERCEELILSCLREAGLEKEEIDYINVHGTGTVTNDLMEARGIARIYGQSPEKRVPVSSIKGMLGHTLGAAGALEGVASTLAVKHDRIPPNTPVESMDEGVDLNVVTKSVGRSVRHVLSLSFAFGGCNVATLFSKP